MPINNSLEMNYVIHSYGKRKQNEVMVRITSSAGMCIWPGSLLGHCLAELEKEYFRKRGMKASSLTLLHFKDACSMNILFTGKHPFLLFICRILYTSQTTLVSTISLNSHIGE